MGMASRIVGAVARRVPAHALDRAEAFLLPRRPFEQLTLPPEGVLTVVCDDGETRDLEVVEMLQRHGVKGVFAVSPDLVGRPGFLGYPELRDIHAAGHEIAFHGTTHDPFTGFAGPEALTQAARSGLARLQAEGLGTPPTVIYPYGSNNRWVRQAMSGLFSCAFTTWVGVNRGQVNRYALRRVPFGAYTGKLPATEPWYRHMIDQCGQAGGWLALMLHPAATEHTPEHTAMLGRLLEHAKARGVAVRTVSAQLQGSARPWPSASARKAAP